LAIYHLTANVISRARGQSAVAAAAYRSGATLRDERYGITHHYTSRRGAAAHSEIMSPPEVPVWVHDRAALWNRVEAGELRKDSQLARVIDVGLPIELAPEECVALVRGYIASEFVAKGMIADFSIRRDDPHNPHAHILLTLRSVGPSGFGPKERRWNGKANLLGWRSAWADQVNEHLARAGHSVRIDHRTLEAQQIELTPGRNVGVGRARRGDENLADHLRGRIAEQQRIVQENGDAILEDPTVVLRALTHQRPTFTHRDLAEFLRSRIGAAQFDAVYLAVTQSQELVAATRSRELVALSPDGDQNRFTSRDMMEAARSLKHRAVSMASRRGHGVAPDRRSAVLSRFSLSGEQLRAFDYLVADGDAKAIAVADADKDALLAAARLAWDAEGLKVAGAARSRMAADKVHAASGIPSRALADWEEGWQQGRDPLTREGVLVVDGSEMIDLKQLERFLAVADKARAKVVLIGDSIRLGTMRIESPFRDVLLEIGLTELAGPA
jgi:Ti-type conjugative transfer relaxase TraA